MVRKGIFWTIGEYLYFICYPIIFYQWVKVYRVEIMDIGKILLNHWHHWNIQIQTSQ